MTSFKINTKELIEVIDKNTNERTFLFLKDGEWVKITEKEYNNIIEGEKNDL